MTQFELEADYDNEEYSSDYDESDDDDWLQDLSLDELNMLWNKKKKQAIPQ
jgi:hypothetical protein